MFRISIDKKQFVHFISSQFDKGKSGKARIFFNFNQITKSMHTATIGIVKRIKATEKRLQILNGNGKRISKVLLFYFCGISNRVD